MDATVVPTTSSTNTTSIDYTVTLDKPGDFYEFTVDAVNDGTIDAMIQNINMTSLDADVAKYLSYTATYLDGRTLAQNDVLEADDSTTYKVRVEFKKNIEASDLAEEDMNLNLTFGVNYIQSTMPPQPAFIKLVKNNALSDNSINFKTISSESNGRGLYVMESTKNDTYPIYYYRGNVSNNNAKFAGYCWKIVRTTETGGKSVEDALNEMNINTNSSVLKTTVDDWFENTFKTYFVANNKDYNNYLEDTIWCNDRSINTISTTTTGGYSAVNNGWKPNGGGLMNNLVYSPYGRIMTGTPRVDCPNKNDSFTVKESATGNGALDYPVGLLTLDEVNLAGGQLYHNVNENKDYYLYNERYWWTMSPYGFNYNVANGFRVNYGGDALSSDVPEDDIGVRPSISLKSGVKIAEGGDGTSATPYEFLVD